MKNKLYKILPAILLIAIVVVGAGMYVRFNGNPFIKVSLNKEAKNYVRQNYPEIADKVQLSPQGVYVGHYNDTPVFLAYFSNPDDKLMYFHLMYDKDGNFVYDGYSDHYMKGGTVYYYHSATYGGIVSELFNDYFCDGRGTASVSLDTVLNSNSGHGTFLDSDTDMYEGYKGPVLDVANEYDTMELAAEYGRISFYFTEDEEHTKENLYNIMKDLIKVPGVSGTPSEVPVADAIKDLVMEIPYFREHPENVKLVPVEKDRLGRSIVTAYMELAPESKETVILTGHYDVVDVDAKEK